MLSVESSPASAAKGSSSIPMLIPPYTSSGISCASFCASSSHGASTFGAGSTSGAASAGAGASFFLFLF